MRHDDPLDNEELPIKTIFRHRLIRAMEKQKEEERHIPSHGIFLEHTETHNRLNERTHRTGSRRTRGSRTLKQEWTLPPRGEPTGAEIEMMNRLEELRDASGGIGSEERVLTVVMIMNEERRPPIHERLLVMVGLSSERILKKLLESHQFLTILGRWLEMYGRNESWCDVTARLLEVIGKLPLSRSDEHGFRLAFKRLSSQGINSSIDKSIKALLHRWEEQRRDLESSSNPTTHSTLSRMHSWPTRKVGKALVASDPNLKSTKSLKRKSNLSHRRSSSVGSSLASNTQKSTLRPNGLTPEAMNALRRLRKEKAHESSKTSLPSVLVHSMDTPPTSPSFYIKQQSLYNTLRLDRGQSIPELVDTDRLMAQIAWMPPPTCRLPPGDVIRAPTVMLEQSAQDERERTIPPSDSGLLFSCLLESVTSGDKPVFEFPFFPRNREQHEQQKKVCMDAGIACASVLEPADVNVNDKPTKLDASIT